MQKIGIISIIIGGSFILGSNLVIAHTEEVVYDLNNHQLIESYVLEDDGEIVDITIIDNSLFSRMADKTYTVSKNKKNSWSISYKVSVKNNKIVSAYDGSFIAAQGSFSNSSVTRHSNSSASAKGAWRYHAATNTIQVKTTVVNNNLSVK